MSARARWIAVAVSAGAALAPSPATSRGAEPELSARIDGVPVTRAELQRMIGNPSTVAEARRLLGVEQPDAAAVEALAMRKILELRLLRAEARRRGIQVTEKEVEAEFKALRDRFDDLDALGAWIREQGLDEVTIFDAVREDLEARRAREALVKDVRLSDGEVERYRDAHAQEFRREEVRLQVIAVREEHDAHAVVAALKSGQRFAAVARRRSAGERASQGGDTGWVLAESLGQPLREAAARLKPRQFTAPLRRGAEFVVVRLHDRRHVTRPVAEVRPEVERRLLPARRGEVLAAWLEERAKGTKVEWSRPAPGGATAWQPR